MKFSEMAGGRFFRAGEIDRPRLVKVSRFSVESFGVGDEKKSKYVLWPEPGEGPARGFVLGQVTLRQLQDIAQSDDPEALIGRTVVAYNDPSVSFNGKAGGIRFRAPRPAAVLDDPLPF